MQTNFDIDSKFKNNWTASPNIGLVVIGMHRPQHEASSCAILVQQSHCQAYINISRIILRKILWQNTTDVTMMIQNMHV